MLKREEFYLRWSQLHGNTEIKGAVASWLNISYRIGLICTLLRITPNILTLLGLLSAIAMALTPHSLWAIALLVLSLFFDGIDGSVAIFQHRESNWGAILDSVSDRISEALWLYVLYRAGVPAWVAIAIWTIASTQEYARARLASLGHHDIEVITPTERPVRAIFIFIALVAERLGLPGVNIFSYLFVALHLFGFYQVMRASYKVLK